MKIDLIFPYLCNLSVLFITSKQLCFFLFYIPNKSVSFIRSYQRCLGGAIITAGARLTELDLSDNAFGPDGVKGIEQLLKSPSCHTLRVLKLNNCGMGVGGGKVSREMAPPLCCAFCTNRPV